MVVKKRISKSFGIESDTLTIAEHLEALDLKIWAELTKSGCTLLPTSPFAGNPREEINMRDCPAEIRPNMREFWELLQVVRRMKRLKLG